MGRFCAQEGVLAPGPRDLFQFAYSESEWGRKYEATLEGERLMPRLSTEKANDLNTFFRVLCSYPFVFIPLLAFSNRSDAANRRGQ
jgi:hypothetical protein